MYFLFLGKIPFIHVGNQVVSELGPIVQFTKAKVNNNENTCIHRVIKVETVQFHIIKIKLSVVFFRDQFLVYFDIFEVCLKVKVKLNMYLCVSGSFFE